MAGPKVAARTGLTVAGFKAAAAGSMMAGPKVAALEVTAGLLLLPAFELPRGLDSECPVTEFVLLRQLSLREHGRLDALVCLIVHRRIWP